MVTIKTKVEMMPKLVELLKKHRDGLNIATECAMK